MAEFLLGGRVIEAIVALIACEGALLLLWRASTGRGPAPTPLIATLLAGAFLLLALRAVVLGASAGCVGVCLAASLVAHVADIASRWDRPAKVDRRPIDASRMRATLSLRVSQSRARNASRARSDESSDVQ